MITEFGMSERYRNITLPTSQSGIAGVGGTRDYSEKAQEYIDSETARMISDRYAVVKGNLQKNKDALVTITTELLETEVLSGERFEELAKSKVIV